MSIIYFEQLAQKAKQRHLWNLAKQQRSFPSVDSLDQSVAAFLSVHGAKLSRGTFDVLDHLRRHSVKILGVSFGRIEYISESLKLSESTVKRAIRLLESLGMLKRIPTKTAQGGQGVNLIVIQPFSVSFEDPQNAPPPVADEPKKEKAPEAISSSRNGFSSNKKNDIDIYITFNRKFDNFRDSNLHKYGLEHIQLPEPIKEEVYVHLIANLEPEDFRNDSRRSIHLAIMRSCNKFLEFYRRGHRITSYGAYFLSIFKDQMERQRIASA